MKIYLNEELINIGNVKSAYEIRDKHKSDADIVILNGFIIKS